MFDDEQSDKELDGKGPFGEGPFGDEPEPTPSSSPVPFQFSLITLFLVITLCSVLFAAFGGLLRHSEEGDSLKGRFIIITLIAPVGLMILYAAWHALFGPKKPRRKKRRW